MYSNEDLVLQKTNSDISSFTRPSSTSFVCFVFDETLVTDGIRSAVKKAVFDSGKSFVKAAFCGLDRKNQRRFKKEFSNQGVGIGFFDGLEDAKKWLLP